MSGYYSDDLLEEIRNANDIVDVVSEYVKLKRSGRNYFGLCPFHAEKTPSFSVSPDKQIFHCFGCGTGGNVMHFVSKIENLEFVETVRHLAERARIELPGKEWDAAQSEKVKLKEQLYLVNKEAARFFYNNLGTTQAEAARVYLKKRGISSQAITKFGLGFAYGVNNDLSSHLAAKGFTNEIIIAAGLAYQDKKDNLRDKFRARIMYPILDVRDKVIGFGGRVLDNSLPKYLNSPETEIFNKRRNLYGLNLARKSNEKTVMVVEGYMDAIALYQYGFTNVVASLGTSFTLEQGRLLRKYFDDVVIAYDSDTAGKNAAVRSIEMLSDMEIPVRVIDLDTAKDPDEFIRKNGERAFKELVGNAKSLAEFKIEMLKTQFDLSDTKGKIDFVNRMAVVLSKVNNNIERDVYVRKISGDTGIGVEPIYSEINRILNKSIRKLRETRSYQVVPNKQLNSNSQASPKIIKAESILIALLSTNDKRVFRQIKDKIGIEGFSSETLRTIAAKLYKMHEERNEVSASDLLNELADENEINAYTSIIQQEYRFEDNDKALEDIIETLEKQKIERRKNEILMELKNNHLAKGDVERLEEELKTITFRLQIMKKG